MTHFHLVSMALVAALASAQTPPDGLGDGRDAERVSILELLNHERAELGLEPLRLDDALSRAAQTHADDMAAQDYVAFTSPDGRQIEDWVRDEGYRARLVTEKIAQTATPAPSLIESWGRSPDGSKNSLFHPDVRDLGVGIAAREGASLYALALAVSEGDYWEVLTAPLKDVDRIRQEMLERLNQLRAERKLPRLKHGSVLHRVAQAHAEELLDETTAGSARQRAVGIHRRLRAERYQFRRAGENVILGPFTVDDALQAALDEETHRGNLFEKAYQETGLGVAVSEEPGSQTVVWVQYFALPRFESLMRPDGR